MREGENKRLALVDSTQSDDDENPTPIITENIDIASYKLEPDTFSFVFISKVCSAPFIYAIIIVSIQMVILILCLVGLFRGSDIRNPLQVPVNNTNYEDLAQALAILVSIFIAGDLVNSLHVFNVHYDSEKLRDFEHAARFKWYLANALRFVVGGLGLFVSFFFILQGTDVLDLFLDFAVVQFVSELDDIGFAMARKGVFLAEVHDATDQVEKVRMGHKKNLRVTKSGTVYSRWKVYLYLLIFVTLFLTWGLIKFYQNRGDYFGRECQSFYINFEGDYSYDFFRRKCPTYDDEMDRECPPKWRTLVRDIPLRYSAFSDIYYAAKDESNNFILENQRPVYYQRLNNASDFGGFREHDIVKDDPNPRGKISYCKNVGAWIFSVDRVSKGARANDCSWLVKSMPTTAYHLGEVPEGDWEVWAGVIAETTVDITCAECVKAKKVVGCSFRGECGSDNLCECNKNENGDNEFMGFQCGTCTKCRDLEVTMAIADNDFDIPYHTSTYEIAKYKGKWKDRGDIQVYDRQVYSQQGSNRTVLLLYTGNRYAIWKVMVPSESSTPVDDYIDDYMYNFHSTWSIIDASKPLYETESTRERSPFGLKWYKYDNSDKYGSKEEVRIQFECTDAQSEGQCSVLF